MNPYHICIFTLLGHHLLLLDRAYTVLRIEYNDFRSRNIGKSCQRCLSGIAGSGGQNDDFFFFMIFARCGGHEIWKDGKCHILKCDRLSLEQLQEIHAIRFC